ncbi:MAG: multiple sugar transport system substrate-binding protein [Thermomicrobiales bacterium]|nr:multiple sugar transport system substrate-binding protein [Thermomicrobiales bacterium]
MNDELLARRISTRARVLAPPAGLALALAGQGVRRAGAQDQPTVRLTGWTSSDAENKLFAQIVQDAQTATNVKIDYQPIPSDYPTKLQTDIAAGSVADVFYLDSMPAPDFMSNDTLLALDSYMSEAGVKAEDFYPGLIAAFQYGGKTYGLPKDWSSLAMVYDKTALTDAGIANAPANWDELKAAGQALRDKTGEPRINIPPDFARYLAFHYAGGASVISEDGSQITLDSPEAEAALTFYYGLYKDGIATTPADAGAGWPGDAFAKDFADIVFEGNWMFPFLEDNAPDIEFGVAEMPAGPAGKATLAFTVSFSIYANTKVSDAAWNVTNYLTGPEGMEKWTSLGLAMPARPALADAWLAKFPEREAFLKTGEYAKPWQLGVGGQAFFNDANAELQNLFAGGQDVKTTLQNMAKAAQNRIQLQPK